MNVDDRPEQTLPDDVVWLKAYCSWLSSSRNYTEYAADKADQCLAAYRKRFREKEEGVAYG